MKHYTSLLLITPLIFLIQCTQSNNTIVADEDAYLIDEFKNNFFIQCFKIGFDNLPEVDTIIAHDVSRMGDFPPRSPGIQNSRFPRRGGSKRDPFGFGFAEYQEGLRDWEKTRLPDLPEPLQRRQN
jgi:hypothetical protein